VSAAPGRFGAEADRDITDAPQDAGVMLTAGEEAVNSV
jgi:hypothetical protein